MRVKPADPAAGIIRDPQTLQILPPEGAEVPDDTLWRRRLARGEVVEIKAPRQTKTKE